ncbi:MAG: metallophosphoesterase [Thiothrix nivea]|nr:MAG: metallophosphoesterase [Thiothrix nivea]
MKQRSAAVRLLQISDTHCYADDGVRLAWTKSVVYPNRSLLRLLTHLESQKKPFDALVISGDLVQEETAATYRRYREILQDFHWPVYILPGNHDVPELMHSELATAEHIHFQFHEQFSGWHCLFLNTHRDGHAEGYLETEQLIAVEEQLNQLKANEHALLFMHHHPVPIGSSWMNRLGLQHAGIFWSLLAQFPQVKAVSFGHIHSEFSQDYCINQHRVIQTFSTPATCVQIKHTDEKLRFDHTRPAWRELTLHADGQLDTCVHYLPD